MSDIRGGGILRYGYRLFRFVVCSVSFCSSRYLIVDMYPFMLMVRFTNLVACCFCL